MTELRGEIDSNTIIVIDFNTPVDIMDRKNIWTEEQKTEDLKNSVDQMVLTYREHTIQQQQNTHYLQAHVSFSKEGNMLGHKTSLHKFKKIEITPSIFSEHNVMKLEMNSRRKTGKFTNILKVTHF